MPITSLPSPYGIGTLGKSAYDFIDFLSQAGQKWWQILPLGPTSYGDSPYQALSSFAGNPYLIDLDLLIEDGLLTKDEVESYYWGNDKNKVDYGAIYSSRYSVLYSAYLKGKRKYEKEIEKFKEENSSWLDDYVLFMALKRHYGMKSVIAWPEETRKRDKATLARYINELEDDISFFNFLQFIFFKQWNALRSYAKEKSIGIIGDIPIYVALDSAEVWANPEEFQLDENFIPTEVSGVPPDYFNKDGQLWGNPLYNWDKMKEDGFTWWSYYCVKDGEKTARDGRWVKGPGRDFTDTLNQSFPTLSFTAEDLGYLTPEVIALLKASTWPGMKILQFAFDTREKGTYDPKDYSENSVCYTGTHDNSTLMGWIKDADKIYVDNARNRLNITDDNELCEAIIKMGMESKSFLMIVPLQDWLHLDNRGRINTPGTCCGNWVWRLDSFSYLTDELRKHISSVTKKANR